MHRAEHVCAKVSYTYIVHIACTSIMKFLYSICTGGIIMQKWSIGMAK